jgi:hypothetical protein
VLPGIYLRWNISATDGEVLRLNIKNRSMCSKSFLLSWIEKEGNKEKQE